MGRDSVPYFVHFGQKFSDKKRIVQQFSDSPNFRRGERLPLPALPVTPPWSLSTVQAVVGGRRRRRRVVASEPPARTTAGRAQTALRRPRSHLLSTSCLRPPTATQRLRAQLAARLHGEPGRQLMYRADVLSEFIHCRLPRSSVTSLCRPVQHMTSASGVLVAYTNYSTAVGAGK